MLEELFRRLTGYAEFRVQGDAVRFFNLAAKSGFALWGFSREGEESLARVRARDYRKLLPLCRRARVRLRVRAKRGLPFQGARLQRRKGLLLGMAGGAVLYGYLSGFVWGVAVTGAETVTQRQILDAAAREGVRLGAPLGELEPRQATHGILAQVEGLSWASVNTDGCFVEVAVKEGAPAPEVAEEEEWSNMVAAREGVVVAIQAERGRPEVQVGDTVTQGQLLISGLYQQIPDPYGPQPERLAQIVGPARGSVVAETYREFTAQAGASKEELVPTGEESTRYSLDILGLQVPLGLWTQPRGEYQTWRRISRAEALGVALPLALERRVYRFQEVRLRRLSREEQRDEALRALRQVQRDALPQGAKILEEELDFRFGEEGCVVTARCRCQEEIGQVQRILVE